MYKKFQAFRVTFVFFSWKHFNILLAAEAFLPIAKILEEMILK